MSLSNDIWEIPARTTDIEGLDAQGRPDAFDGDAVFKVPFPKVKRTDFPEGRGIFVQAGRQVIVQLPLVEGDRLA